jgi:predicted branched-subunit amino acid permease
VRVRDRLVVSFANTDEVFAVASSNVGEVGRRYMYGLIITPFLGWTLGTALGALAGNVLPASVVSALGIAIYAMFIAIVVPVARVNIGVALCALLAIAISAIFYYLPALSEVPSGFVIIIAAIVSAALFAILRPIEEKEDVQDA